MVKNVVTEDFAYRFANPTAQGVVTLLQTLVNIKITTRSKHILTETAQFNLSQYAVPDTISGGSVVSFSFIPSAQKTKTQDKKVLLHEDIVPVVIAGSSPSGSPTTVEDTIIILSKQDKVKGC